MKNTEQQLSIECEGVISEVPAQDLLPYFQDILKASNSLRDFIRKSTDFLTDENNFLEVDTLEALVGFYFNHKFTVQNF